MNEGQRTAYWLKLDPKRRLIGIVLLLASIMAGLCLVSGSMLLQMRRDTWTAAVTASRNVVMSEATNIEQLMRIYDVSIASAAKTMANPAVTSAAPALRQLALFDRVQDGTFLGPIRILDTSGQIMADSARLDPPAASAAELQALARHRTSAGSGPVIGTPVSDGNGGHMITLSRKFAGADGRFGGIVCGTVQLDALTDRFRHLRIGNHDVVSLFLGDGVMLAHAPGDPLIGRRITGSEIMRRFEATSSGTVVAPAATDGIRRVFTFIHVDGWPLLFDVGISVSDLYASWRHRAITVGVILAVMAAAGSAMVFILSREVMSRARAEAAAKQSEARYRALADGASDIIMRFDTNLLRTYASPSVRTFGFEPEELVGRSPLGWIYPDDQAGFTAMIEQVRTGHQVDAVSYRVRRKDGSYNWVEARYSLLEDGEMLAILRDVDERKRMEFELDAAREALARLSTVDPLTGLANRRALDQSLGHELRRAERDDRELSILLIDVDHFKEYNDSQGHLAGDEALRAVARIIGAAARRPSDLAARYGGEEFVLVLPGTEMFGAISVADALRNEIVRAGICHAASMNGVLTISIGVASTSPGRQQAADALLAGADEALYAAKHAGRNTVRASAVGQTKVT